MSFTGVLLTYEQQITDWADRSYRIASSSPEAQRLSWEVLLARVRSQAKAEPTSIVVRRDPAQPLVFAFGRDVFYVNPHTGAVLGKGSEEVRGFFRTVTDWHRWLGRQGESRAGGRAVTGVCNLAFLVLVMSGFYLWWPRKWTWRQLRPIVWFRGGVRGKARNFNWHNSIGFWCAIPLFLIVFSGVVMSFSWANNLIYRITGDPVPVRGAGPGPNPASRTRGEESRRGREASAARSRKDVPSESHEFAGFDQLWAQAEMQVPGWRTMTLRLPRPEQRSVTFSIEQGSRGRVDLRSQLELNRVTAEVVRWETFDSYSRGRRIRSWLRFIHTGEAGGVLGQTVAGIASAGATILVWTGLMLAWRRLRNWQSRGQIRMQEEPAKEGVIAG